MAGNEQRPTDEVLGHGHRIPDDDPPLENGERQGCRFGCDRIAFPA